MNCTFCQIISGQLEASFVYRDDLCSAFLDLYPVNPGHVLVIPNAHVERFSDLDDEITGHLFVVAKKVYQALGNTLFPEVSANIFLSDGEVAGQEVPHTHLHIAPRHQGDGHQPGFFHADPRQASREELDRIAKLIALS